MMRHKYNTKEEVIRRKKMSQDSEKHHKKEQIQMKEQIRLVVEENF
jgi:hypothetical protein